MLNSFCLLFNYASEPHVQLRRIKTIVFMFVNYNTNMSEPHVQLRRIKTLLLFS